MLIRGYACFAAYDFPALKGYTSADLGGIGQGVLQVVKRIRGTSKQKFIVLSTDQNKCFRSVVVFSAEGNKRLVKGQAAHIEFDGEMGGSGNMAGIS